jgi:tetratricopeptide (TPR) repeat protein
MEGEKMMKYCLKINILSVFVLSAALLTGCGDGTPEQAMSKAVAFARNNEWGKAAKIADRLAKNNPSMAEAHVLRAVTSERSGDRQTALDAARRAAEIDPDNFVTLYTLARLYATDPARSSEAHARLLKAWTKRLSDTRVKILLCNVAMESNSPRTLQYLNNLSKIPQLTKSGILYNQYGVTYDRARNYVRAYNSFLKARQLDKNNPAILLNSARFYDKCYTNKILSRHIRKSDVIRLYQAYLNNAGKDAAGRVEAGARISKYRNL